MSKSPMHIFRGKKILLTGHTGFKGSWLRLLLGKLGAEVVGLSNTDLSQPNLHQLISTANDSISFEIDKNPKELQEIIGNTQPDLIIHLAAQAILRRSLKEPYTTFSSNTLGTLNLLEAFRKSSCSALLVVTSDKCYENKLGKLLTEDDRLGGEDPYSASKAAAEIICKSYNANYFRNHGKFMATARAGNVIGGGDWSEHRLIPDMVRATTNQEELHIRMPEAVRPWQHVLDALNGYLLLGAGLLSENHDCCSAFNFGPNSSDIISVQQIADIWKKKWPALHYKVNLQNDKKEVSQLRLDNQKAKELLNWECQWTCHQAIEKTIEWYRDFSAPTTSRNAESLCQRDIIDFGFKFPNQ